VLSFWRRAIFRRHGRTSSGHPRPLHSNLLLLPEASNYQGLERHRNAYLINIIDLSAKDCMKS
jgi:hypothetical protein